MRAARAREAIRAFGAAVGLSVDVTPEWRDRCQVAVLSGDEGAFLELLREGAGADDPEYVRFQLAMFRSDQVVLRAEAARRGRGKAATKKAKATAPARQRSDERVRALLERLDEDDTGGRRSTSELRRLLREEHNLRVGRSRVERLRAK